jgi:hypothetical protein
MLLYPTDFHFSIQGLKVGDSVVQFGSLTAENFQGLQNIATVVQHSIDVSKYTLFKLMYSPNDIVSDENLFL